MRQRAPGRARRPQSTKSSLTAGRVTLAVLFAFFGLMSTLLPGTISSTALPVFQPHAASAQSVCPLPLALQNGSFETPIIGSATAEFVPEGGAVVWQTTDTNGVLELWSNGFTPPFNDPPVAFTADTGTQMAELNAYQNAQLYQDLDTSTLQGQTLTWSFAHRGRTGVDTMGLYIGSPGAEGLITTASDGNQAWGHYSGTYTVPVGQTTTRFAYRALATANGDPGGGNLVDSIVFGVPQCSPALTIEKTSDVVAGDPVTLGQEVTYTFEVENTGDVDLTGVTVTDPLVGLSAITPATADIPEGGSETYTATYTVTQADVDAGQILNTATATAEVPEGCVDCPPPTDTDDSVITISRTPDIALEKTSDVEDDEVVGVGDTVTYTFVAENTGNVTLSNVTITDLLPNLSATTPPSVATLAPGATATFTATYVVMQADVDAGEIRNSATATGTPPPSCIQCPPPVSPPDEVLILIPPDPGVEFSKVADPVSGVNEGDTITYTFTVTNTGNIAVNNVTIEDALPGLTWVTGPNLGTIAVGDSATGEATYVVTAEDIVNGGVENTATLVCDEGCDPPPPVVIVDPGEPGLILTKVADPETGLNEGDTVTYTFTAENTGEITLHDVTFVDPLPGLTWVTGPNVGTLLPGDIATGEATYVVTAADIIAGGVTNTVTATCQVDCDPTPVTVIVTPGDPGVEFSKVADPATGVNEGDTITYTFTATNTGAVTLNNVTIEDPLDGLTWVTGPDIGTLAPGASGTGTATYVVTAADIVAGGVTNTATVICDLGCEPPPVTVVVTPGDPAVEFSKVADTAGPVSEGDIITYTFTATNTGEITLHDVVIADQLAGLTWVTGPEVGTLAPGEVGTGEATYVVTAEDIANRGVTNTATVTCTFGCAPPPVTVVVPGGQPALSVDKVADTAGPVNEGDVITYTFTATNTGDIVLNSVTIQDPLAGLTWVSGPEVGTLAPGESANGTATYTVTAEDVANGGVTNTATATCDPACDPPPVTVIIPGPDPEPGTLIVEKTADVSGEVHPGDLITYTFVVTNNGGTSVDNVTLSDPLPGLGPISGPQGTTLAPGESATFTAEYAVTESDAVNGSIDNTATATGTDTTGTTVEDDDSVQLEACDPDGVVDPTPTPGEGTPEPVVDIEGGSQFDGAAVCDGEPQPTEPPAPEPTKAPGGGGPVVKLPSTGQPNGAGSGLSPILPISVLILLGLAMTVSLIQRRRQTGK